MRIAITAAFDAIAATLPLGPVAFEPEVDAKGERRSVCLEAAVVDRLGTRRELERRHLAAGRTGDAEQVVDLIRDCPREDRNRPIVLKNP